MALQRNLWQIKGLSEKERHLRLNRLMFWNKRENIISLQRDRLTVRCPVDIRAEEFRRTDDDGKIEPLFYLGSEHINTAANGIFSMCPRNPLLGKPQSTHAVEPLFFKELEESEILDYNDDDGGAVCELFLTDIKTSTHSRSDGSSNNEAAEEASEITSSLFLR
mmetsp:Transcript_12261/g.22306  ORF Transcript_12261/g.22306 Transcript_12261/m.22306 type:complete len:164 (-) Transcript_12261:68-559(-)